MARSISTSEAGDRALYSFISACLARRLLIATPLPHVGYDVIVHNPASDEMWRVQVKRASPLKGKYWVGATHRRRRSRYRPGLIERFVFERPDGGGFWIVDGRRLEGKSGLGLNDQDQYWQKWELFGVKEH